MSVDICPDNNFTSVYISPSFVITFTNCPPTALPSLYSALRDGAMFLLLRHWRFSIKDNKSVQQGCICGNTISCFITSKFPVFLFMST